MVRDLEHRDRDRAGKPRLDGAVDVGGEQRAALSLTRLEHERAGVQIARDESPDGPPRDEPRSRSQSVARVGERGRPRRSPWARRRAAEPPTADRQRALHSGRATRVVAVVVRQDHRVEATHGGPLEEGHERARSRVVRRRARPGVDQSPAVRAADRERVPLPHVDCHQPPVRGRWTQRRGRDREPQGERDRRGRDPREVAPRAPREARRVRHVARFQRRERGASGAERGERDRPRRMPGGPCRVRRGRRRGGDRAQRDRQRLARREAPMSGPRERRVERRAEPCRGEQEIARGHREQVGAECGPGQRVEAPQRDRKRGRLRGGRGRQRGERELHEARPPRESTGGRASQGGEPQRRRARQLEAEVPRPAGMPREQPQDRERERLQRVERTPAQDRDRAQHLARGGAGQRRDGTRDADIEEGAGGARPGAQGDAPAQRRGDPASHTGHPHQMESRERQQVDETRGAEDGAEIGIERRAIAGHERLHDLARRIGQRAREARLEPPAPAHDRGAREARSAGAVDPQSSSLGDDALRARRLARRCAARHARVGRRLEAREDADRVAPFHVRFGRQAEPGARAARHHAGAAQHLDHRRALPLRARGMLGHARREPDRRPIRIQSTRGRVERRLGRGAARERRREERQRQHHRANPVGRASCEREEPERERHRAHGSRAPQMTAERESEPRRGRQPDRRATAHANT